MASIKIKILFYMISTLKKENPLVARASVHLMLMIALPSRSNSQKLAER